MPGFFDRPDPQQAVPRDLAPFRQALLNAILGGTTGNNPYGKQRGVPDRQGGGGGLEALLGLATGPNPGGDVLGPLGDVFDTRLNDSISELNASSPGRFSSANIYQQGQLRQRALSDYNLLASQVLEQGRNRQLQALGMLLGPAMGPTFGGPFTQGASGFDSLLGLIGTVGQIPGIGGIFGGRQQAAGTPYSSPTVG